MSLALAVLVTVILLGCAASAPPVSTESDLQQRIARGYGRVFVFREQQDVYRATPLTISVNGSPIGTLASGTYLSADLPAGAKSLSAAMQVGRVKRNFTLEAGKAAYVVVRMEPLALLSPSGPLLLPIAGIAVAQPPFSVDFVDAPTAMTEFGRTRPAR